MTYASPLFVPLSKLAKEGVSLGIAKRLLTSSTMTSTGLLVAEEERGGAAGAKTKEIGVELAIIGHGKMG